MKTNVDKYSIDKQVSFTKEQEELLNKPCTVTEAVHLARAAAEDVCQDILDSYKRDTGSLIMAMTLQIELLKSIVISNNLISEEEFQEKYLQIVHDFEERQRSYVSSITPKEDIPGTTKMSTDSQLDIEVEKI